MRKNGFIPSCAIHVKQNGDGKLAIIRGHHRFETARELGLPIYYIIDNNHDDMLDLESTGHQSWTIKDFAIGRSNAGDRDYGVLLKYCADYHAPISTVAKLLSCNESTVDYQIRKGMFKIDPNNRAENVLKAITAAADLRYHEARHACFIKGLHFCARVPGFCMDRFIGSMQNHPEKLLPVVTIEQCFEMIELIHNIGLSSKNRVPIAFKAKELRRKSLQSQYVRGVENRRPLIKST
jgi:hypothetical protein